jgi:hypothetical protein
MINIEKLLPCPFCGSGITKVVENGKVWTGNKYSEATSVSVIHHCPTIPGQPHRMIERVGRDIESAVSIWNMRHEFNFDIKQEPLGSDFAEVLYDNAWDMYEVKLTPACAEIAK